MRSGANSGRLGRSIVPSKPRNSTAAKPFWWAKSRILIQSHLGQPRVENPIGNGLLFVVEGSAESAERTRAEYRINCRRVIGVISRSCYSTSFQLKYKLVFVYFVVMCFRITVLPLVAVRASCLPNSVPSMPRDLQRPASGFRG